MKILAKTGRAGRVAVTLGLAVATVGLGLLAVAPAANAQVGTDPGHLTIAPLTGDLNTNPTWTATDNCNAPNNDTAFLAAYGLNGTLVTGVSVNILGAPVAPFGGTLQGSWNDFINAGILQTGTTYELDVLCGSNQVPQQFTYVTLTAPDAANPNGGFSISDTPPSSGTATTTTETVSPTSAAPGDAVNLSATVTPATAAGNVQFFDGGTAIGSPVPVSGGAASTSVSTLACGTHSIIAKFVPTDPTAFQGSQSAGQSVTISGAACALQGSETINVAVPQTGAFTFTVSGTPVDLGTATASGNNLEATGSLSPVTVSDTRNSVPGWSVTGQVSDFSDGSHTINGDSLGWSPAITTPNAANDVTAGSKVNPGANPGLKEGSGLASAAAAKGSGTTVLGGGLDLMVPTTQNPGSYSATLTLTAIDTAA